MKTKLKIFILIIAPFLMLSSFKYIDCHFKPNQNDNTIIIIPQYCNNSIRIERIIKSKELLFENIYYKNKLIESTEFNVWFSSESYILPVVTRKESFKFNNSISDQRLTRFNNFSSESKNIRLCSDTFLTVNYQDNGLYNSINIISNDKWIYGIKFNKLNDSFWEGHYKGTLDTLQIEGKDGSIRTIITRSQKKGVWYKVNNQNSIVDSLIEK